MRFHGIINGTTSNQSKINIKSNSVIYDALEYILSEYAVDVVAFSTWTEIVKDILGYIILPKEHILIEDADGVELIIDTAIYEWQSISIFELLNEIARFTKNNMFVDEYGLIVFYPRETKNNCATLFSRGINIVENEIDKDASNIINDVKCAVAFKKENTVLSSYNGSLSPNAFDNSERYVRCNRRLTSAGSDISNITLNIRRVGLPIGFGQEGTTLTTFQIVEGTTWGDDVIASGTIDSDDVGLTFSMLSFPVAGAPVNIQALGSLNVSLIINKSLTAGAYYELGLIYGSSTQNAFHSTNGSTWTDELYLIFTIVVFGRTIPITGAGCLQASIHGLTELEYFSTYQDSSSLYLYGSKSRSLIAKYCRSQEAIDLISETIVERYKDGIWTGSITIPFTKINKRTRVIIQDIFNNIEYENILITSVNYTPYSVQIQLTESTELPDDLSKTSKLAINMEKELYT